MAQQTHKKPSMKLLSVKKPDIVENKKKFEDETPCPEVHKVLKTEEKGEICYIFKPTMSVIIIFPYKFRYFPN